jgi:hypothetical protein
MSDLPASADPYAFLNRGSPAAAAPPDQAITEDPYTFLQKPPVVIDPAIAERYGTGGYQQPANPSEHLRKMLGGGMLEGAGNLLGLPGSVIAALPSLPPAAVSQLSAAPTTPETEGIAQLAASGGGLRLPTGEDINAKLKELGMVGQPIQEPQNAGERLMYAGAQGFGGTAPLGIGGGLAGLVKAALQGVMSGVGGQAGQEYLSKPLSELTATQPNSAIPTLAGVLAGQMAGGGLYGMAGRGINAMRGVGNPVVSAYDLAGVKPRLAGDVTGTPLLQGFQSLAMRAPFGGRAIRAAQAGASEFGNSVENYARQFGRAETEDQAGLALQAAGRNWMGQFRKNQEQAEQAVSAKVPGTSIVSMDPVKDVLNETLSKMPDAPHVAAMMTNPVFQGLSGALGKDLRGPQPYLNDPLYATSGTVPPPVPARPGLEWDTARAWRTKVGEQLEMSLVSRDGNDAAWKRIYGALSGALGDTAGKAGAGAEWQAANAITNQGHNFIENTLSNIINHPGAQNSIRPDAAANYVLNSGSGPMQDVRAAMPSAANELASFKLRDMAAATPGRRTAEQPYSATTFSTELNRLTPEERTALFGSYSPMLDALQTVAERGKETFQHYGNASGSGGNLAHLGAFTAPLAISEAANAGHEVYGFPGMLMGGAAATLPYISGPISSYLTAREALTRYLAAPVGGPGTGASRLYRAAGAGSALAPLLATPGEHAR